MQKLLLIASLLIFIGCRKGDSPVSPVVTPVDTAGNGIGFYVLNEGNMGSNKASLDYYDYSTGAYNRNIYPTVNPTVVKELGDVGNDMQVYGNKLFAVINGSNKVEVMEAATAKHIGQIDIQNCRYITFANGKAFVSSYAGTLGQGFVAEVDTASLLITNKVTVGRQPEEMAIVNGKLYVANSGGYRSPDYDSTVSVIDLTTFTELKKINVAINLSHVKTDSDGDVYVVSQGDYYNIPSALFVIDSKTDAIKKKFAISASNLCIAGDTAYIYGTDFSYITNTTAISYGMINVKTETVLPGNFITDGTAITMPYSIAVNPVNKDIFVTDAINYVSSGALYCFNKAGKKKWSVTTGDLPAHIAFLLTK